MKKRLLALLLAMLSLLSLTGCGEWEDPAQDGLYETLAEYYGKTDKQDESPALTSFSLPYLVGETADPITCTDGTQQTLGLLLYEGLFALDPSFNPQPMLAESYTYDVSRYTYAITLRSGVTFSDGTALTAWDVVYSLRRACNSDRYANRLQDVIYISGSANTVYIELSRDNAAFISRLDVPIVKYGTESRTYPVGTGPYYYGNDGQGVCLLPYSGWWQQKKLPLDRIGLYRCKDSDTVAYAFYAREVQLLMCDLTATSTTNVYGSGDYIDAAGTTLQYVGMNMASEPLDDAAVRRALHRGIDRSSCVSAFLLGHGMPAQFPLSPVSALYPTDLDITYSPDHFDTAIADAGYSSGDTVYLTMLVNSENSFKVRAAQKIASDLSRHDLQIRVESLPWEQYLSALLNGEFDLYYGECRLTADWDLYSLIGSNGRLNYGYYSNSETDALLQRALSASESDRAAAFLALCTHLARECPILPVCFKSSSVLLPSGTVENVTPTAADPFYNFPEWKISITNKK
ncbi:MAG: ABC transporter substrate-binding protein [Oscillospiraceae bacterium]|nr:ABC transporter substrate-binding protein [Oscillospiraceae bacterium]